MKSFAALLVVIITAFVLSPPAAKVPPADLVFNNGNIYTVNEARPKAEAVAIKGDRIVFVGSNREAQTYVGRDTRVIDLNGKTMVPGMTDAHHHLSGVGFREMTLNLEGVNSLEDFLAKVKARVDMTGPGEWVSGRGWIETFWTPPVFPTRWNLDKVSPFNPVILTRADGHGAVVNSVALKIAGIDKHTPSPFGGEISKDKQSGEPNGMLLDAAQDLVRRYLPPTSAADAEQAIILGVKRDIELGWTQVQDPGGSYADVGLYSKLYSEGKIKLRIYKALSAPGKEAQRVFHDGPIIGAYANRFTVRTLKFYADGSLGSRSAALLQPYSDAPDTSGFLTIKEEELQPLLQEALRKGIQIQTHAIGDRGNRFILDQYEKAMNAVPKAQWKIKEPRWRVEHSQIVNPADIPRFAKLGVIPSMQPSHAIGDLHFAPSRLGIARLAGAYAWQSFIKSGSIVPGGSDAPVERGEPMIEFYAAVARKDMKGFSGEGWHPEEKVSREQALKMFTIWPAYAAFEEALRGSIEPGKLADLTILSADIMTVREMEILQTRCLMTVIGGEIVYEAK
ncbi:MAG TPA: amidohydrolase [Blastocatellia bacterium]|jgi:predicted amidohydrolase YtcJ|nr:amidohydrolase [Blastocatellia bacterium]HAF22371.1 amidohydrolase [Blastocatellia bacterium]